MHLMPLNLLALCVCVCM